MIGLPAPLAVVCHDAGATNLILPWLDSEHAVRPVMHGPAERLWKQRFHDKPSTDLVSALEGAVALLSGTGWASNLEHRARKLARERGLRSVAVIDHWVNYRERFVRDGEEVLPDVIWVTDEHALAIAKREFPRTDVQLRLNLYLREQAAHAPGLLASDNEVLFVSEPVRTDWGWGTPGEFQALEYFLRHCSAVGVPSDAPIRIRPHPADPAGKYDSWLGGRISLDGSPNLAAALGHVRWVVGCESYALVVALEAGRQAISALPPWAPPCRLPQGGIIHMASL